MTSCSSTRLEWVHSLLHDSSISLLDAQPPNTCVLCPCAHVNIALMAHIGEVFEPNFVAKAISIPHWYDAMNLEISSTREK